MPYLTEHQHGKSKVRLGRTWRCASTGQHDFVEWEIEVQLLSRAMNAAYTNGTNDGMTTTDTTKNMVRTYLCHIEREMSVVVVVVLSFFSVRV
jgi:urate oxidase